MTERSVAPSRSRSSSSASPESMLLLLSEPTFVQFGDRLAAAVPELQFLRMQADGDLLLDDRAITWEEASPDVAWLTADLFAGGPVRKFLKLTLLTKPAWLQSSGAGTDHPVFQMLLDGGTRLTASHVTGVPIAEYVLRAVLEHYQQPALWAGARRDSEWAPHDFREVFGTTWLIVGVGHIGSEVATRAKAFGATVVGVRRSPDGSEPVDECVPPDRLREAVGRADVVVLAAPGGPETRHLFGADLLPAMRPRSVLVNVGRGSLVDEHALRRALDARCSRGRHPRRDRRGAPVCEPLAVDAPACRPHTPLLGRRVRTLRTRRSRVHRQPRALGQRASRSLTRSLRPRPDAPPSSARGRTAPGTTRSATAATRHRTPNVRC